MKLILVYLDRKSDRSTTLSSISLLVPIRLDLFRQRENAEQVFRLVSIVEHRQRDNRPASLSFSFRFESWTKSGAGNSLHKHWVWRHRTTNRETSVAFTDKMNSSSLDRGRVLVDSARKFGDIDLSKEFIFKSFVFLWSSVESRIDSSSISVWLICNHTKERVNSQRDRFRVDEQESLSSEWTSRVQPLNVAH